MQAGENSIKTKVRRFHRAEHISVISQLNLKFSKVQIGGASLKILLMQTGSCVVTVCGTRHKLTSPSIICLNELEGLRLETEQNTCVSLVEFHPSYVNKHLDYSLLRTDYSELPVTTRQDAFLFKPFTEHIEGTVGYIHLSPFTLSVFETLLRKHDFETSAQSHRYWSCMARSYLIELLFKVVQLYSDSEVQIMDKLQNKDELVEKALRYLNEHYMEKLTLGVMCRELGTNRTTLQERFKASTGDTFNQHLIKIRLQIAALFLQDTSISIYEIAIRTGFSDSSHFNKSFTKLHSVSPSTYRVQNRIAGSASSELSI